MQIVSPASMSFGRQQIVSMTRSNKSQRTSFLVHENRLDLRGRNRRAHAGLLVESGRI
jgi:hypothetical protein